jgi:hypothetical protein
MKKAKPRAGRERLPRQATRQKPADLAEIRRQIADLVGNGALVMVETTIEEAGKGHYLGMKYLFEMIGLYPETSAADDQPMDSMAAILLRRLGLSEEPVPEQSITKGSETPSAGSEDVLE